MDEFYHYDSGYHDDWLAALDEGRLDYESALEDT